MPVTVGSLVQFHGIVALGVGRDALLATEVTLGGKTDKKNHYA